MNRTDLPFDPIHQLRARWRRIVVATVIVAGGASSYALVAPRWYSAHLSVVPSPPKTPSGMSLLGGGTGGLGALGGALDLADLGMGSMDAERVAAIFKSTQVSDAVITEFDLVRRYRDDYVEDAREDLWDHCSVKVEKKSSVVTLSCEDKSPETARAMLAFFGKYGNETFIRIATSSAGEERRFLEQRVAQARRDLEAASTSLREFSEQNKLVDIGAQARAVVETMAQLQGELITKQMELSFLQSFSARGEATSAQLARHIAILQSQLASLESPHSPESLPSSGADKEPRPTKRGSQTTSDPGILPLAASVPRLQVELAQRYREVKTQETVFLFLTQMYEIARVNEARSTPTFQILDPPVLPVKHARPKRLLICLGGTLLGIVIGICWAIGGAWWSATLRRPRRHRADEVVDTPASAGLQGSGDER
jgi:uncharacterized protein involved in exopolysaccharide biosynthesis